MPLAKVLMLDTSEKNWYAIRVTYNREMMVKRDLDSKHIENFLPMKYKVEMCGERKIKVLKPAINNLIFIYTSSEKMKEYKEFSSLPIRYIMNHETHQPIIVPTKQMQDFIAVAGTMNEQLIYLEPDMSSFTKGDRVRVTGGVFAGAEGQFMRIRGDRRVVVCIPGIAAVATAFVHPSLVEKISD